MTNFDAINDNIGRLNEALNMPHSLERANIEDRAMFGLIGVGLTALVSIADSLREISENISSVDMMKRSD